jgi:deoxyribodipyrimidine photolyase-related protein
MNKLRLILNDQLSFNIPTLKKVDNASDTLMFCELIEDIPLVKPHQKKLAFLWSAMRHFAQALALEGFRIRYLCIEDPKHSGSLEGELLRALDELRADQLILTEPSQWSLIAFFRALEKNLKTPVIILEDDRFLASHEDFRRWAQDKKQLRMEFFYRMMRKKHHLLMEGENQPCGGRWNYDQDNRKPPKKGMTSIQRLSHRKSALTQAVLQLVAKRFGDHFGTLEPFHYAVTRSEALLELGHFIEKVLPYFGDYQDAMLAGEPYLNHSLLSSYLNVGLLDPLEICGMAERAYRRGQAPLNAVEGFIRQILGWREYVRGIYHWYMPGYANLNYFEAKRPLPGFYWDGDTKMFCVAEAIHHTREQAYSHHIQRLMVTGNFALLAGLDVKEVQAWYLAVYSDAHEWVEMPNTLGMALFGDGGLMASKPYAASGAYIKRMSNFCEKCSYDPSLSVGEKACPFNALYWDFMARNQKKLQDHPRVFPMLSTWNRFSDEKQRALQNQAQTIISNMEKGCL